MYHSKGSKAGERASKPSQGTAAHRGPTKAGTCPTKAGGSLEGNFSALATTNAVGGTSLAGDDPGRRKNATQTQGTAGWEDVGDDWDRTMDILREGRDAGSDRQRALSLFKHLDVDNDQRIRAWELARFFPSAIGCTAEERVELAFFCRKLGLTLEEDESGMIVVAGWVEGSAAAEHPSLMVGMRVLSIDGWDVPCALTVAGATMAPKTAYGKGGRFIESCLKKCEKVLEEVEGGEKALHVLEVAMPAVVVTSSNTWLDINMNGSVIAVTVPLGIYATREAYFSALQDAGRDQHPTKLKYFGVKYTPTRPFVVLTAGYAPFAILWRSGVHRSQNCRRIFFCDGEEDTDVQISHTTGRWDTVAIEGTKHKLKLKSGALTDFAEYLMLTVLESRRKGVDLTEDDSSSMGEEEVSMEYEEFCSLYSIYLSSQEGLWRSRDLLMVGFMGKEEYEEIRERQSVDDMRRKRLRKMVKSRKFNKERKKEQMVQRREKERRGVRSGEVLLSQTTGDRQSVSAPASFPVLERPAHQQDDHHLQEQPQRKQDQPNGSLLMIPSAAGPSSTCVATIPVGGDRYEAAPEMPWDHNDGGAREGGGGGRGARDRAGGWCKSPPKTRHTDYPEEDLEERRMHLLSQRVRMKAIKRNQQKAAREKILDATNENLRFEAELGGSGRWGNSKRTTELARLGLEDCRSGQRGKRPQPEDIHPAFLGYFHHRRSSTGTWDPTVRSPVFFGRLSGGLTRLEAIRGEGNLVALKALLNGVAFTRSPEEGWASSEDVEQVKEVEEVEDGEDEEDEEDEEDDEATQGGNRIRKTCLAFPLAPSTRGRVRQRLRQVGEAYDRAEMVHPSCFGLMTIPDDEDCRNQSPVFFGYDLAKKPRSRAGALPEDEAIQREDFVVTRKGRPCPVCLVGKPGCPCCWNFPEGYVPHDFAYLGPFEDSSASGFASQRSCSSSSRPTSAPGGGSISSLPTLGGINPAPRGSASASAKSCVDSVGASDPTPGRQGANRTSRVAGQSQPEHEEERIKPELHTDLTTGAAITLYRNIIGSIIRIFVKVVPCGTATCLWMDSSWPVSYLYDLWRANSVEGCTIEAIMCIPTMVGQWKLDNRNLPETDTTLGIHTGNLPISTYNLTKSKSTVTVLCTTMPSSLQENIERYLVYETGIGRHAVLDVIDHLVGCPKHPEEDPIQKVLCSVMEHRMEQQYIVDRDEDSAEREERNQLLLDAEKARKEKALAEKRKKVAYGSKEWRMAQRTLREREAMAAMAAATSTKTFAPGAFSTEMMDAGFDQKGSGRGGGGRRDLDENRPAAAEGGLAGRAALAIGGKLSRLNLSFKTSKKKPFV